MRSITTALAVTFLTAGMTTLMATSATAHHGWSVYQDGFTLTGTIRDIKFMNPHDSIVLEDDEGNMWKVLFAPPVRNKSIGFTADSLEVGWKVTLHGERHVKDDVFEMKTETIEHDGEVIYEYPHPGGRR